MLQFRADRSLTIPNMVLILQPDGAGRGTGVSLTTLQKVSDGMSVIFGEYLGETGVEKLVGIEIWMRGSKMYTGAGSMLRTPTAVYKPREAVLQITSISEREATGTIKGAFHRFAAPQTAISKPTEVLVDAAFKARLIIK